MKHPEAYLHASYSKGKAPDTQPEDHLLPKRTSCSKPLGHGKTWGFLCIIKKIWT